MKLTKDHISEENLNILIEKYGFYSKYRKRKNTAGLIVLALLELKHRRAEDRLNEQEQTTFFAGLTSR